MYSRENYQKVKQIIENRYIDAINEADRRNMEVRMQSEDIRLIDAELTKTGLAIFKAACAGEDINPIKERNELLQKARVEALSKLSLPADYTEPKYTCPECSDRGFVGTRMCKCFKEMLITENIKSSGMGKLIEKQSFDNFDLSIYKDNEENYKRMQKNLDVARDFAEGFGNAPSATLLFFGKTGTGKTHLSTAVAKRIIERGFDVLYDSAQNIFTAFENDRFKSGYGPYEPEATKFLECDLLILDDLGTEFANQFTVSCLYNLINTRQNKGLSTIISTNLSYEELSHKYEDRIFSRIVGSDSKVLLFSGHDRRVLR